MENLNFFKLLFFRIYHFLFIERFFKKLSFNFPENIFRWNLIQLIIDKNNLCNMVIYKKIDTSLKKFLNDLLNLKINKLNTNLCK